MMAANRLAGALGAALLACIGACGFGSSVGCGGATPPLEAPERTSLPPLELPVVALPRTLDRGVEVGEPPRRDLAPFFERLQAIERGQPGATASVLHLGDSHVASDTISGELRDVLQSRFGDGGRGYAQPQGVSRVHRQESMTLGGSGSWLVEHAMQREEPLAPIGVSGIRVTADEAGVTLSRAACPTCRFGAAFDRALVHYLETADGGSFVLRAADGSASRVIATSGDESTLGVASLDLVEGPHEVIVEALGDGPVHILGVATERSAGGLRYESMGLNGARAAHWGRLDASLLADEIRSRGTDLVVVAFGTNEAFGDRFRYRPTPEMTPEEMSARFDGLLEEIHSYASEFEALLRALVAGVPDASCLVLLPPDFHDRNAPCEDAIEAGDACLRMPPDSLGRVVAAQRRAADAVGCAVWDQQAAMGGPGGMSVWQQEGLGRDDGIHLSMAGYDAMGVGLYRDLMQAFERWKLGGAPVLHTSRILADPFDADLIGYADDGATPSVAPTSFEPAQ
jgi:lysophospholipase L1-like esterase